MQQAQVFIRLMVEVFNFDFYLLSMIQFKPCQCINEKILPSFDNLDHWFYVIRILHGRYYFCDQIFFVKWSPQNLSPFYFFGIVGFLIHITIQPVLFTLAAFHFSTTNSLTFAQTRISEISSGWLSRALTTISFTFCHRSN